MFICDVKAHKKAPFHRNARSEKSGRDCETRRGLKWYVERGNARNSRRDREDERAREKERERGSLSTDGGGDGGAAEEPGKSF